MTDPQGIRDGFASRLMRSRRTLLAVSLLVASLGECVAAADSKPAEAGTAETWQVIHLSGQRIGYSYSKTEAIQESETQVLRTVSESHMTIKRFGQSLVIQQTMETVETEAGDLLRFRFQTDNPPASTSTTHGTVHGSELRLAQTVDGQTKNSVQVWRPDVKSPGYQERVLQRSPLQPGDRRSFEAFVPDFSQVATIVLVAVDWENTPLLQGPEKKLLTVKMTQSLLPGVVLIGSVDEHGQTLKTSTRMLGTTLETFQVTRDQALKAIEGSELDLAVSTLIKVPRIRHPQQTKKVVYRATTLGQNPLEILPTGETQTITKTGAETAELTVISVPIPAQATIEPVDGRFTAASQYLQRDDVIVQQHAQKGAGDETDPAQIARRMESYVHTALTKKNFSTAMASAGEVARTLEGDCTEHALLLAAMLRVKAIPSRVAVGLVYVDSLSAFGGHMWTEACLNGHWIPLDATLGRGGTGATHLKLSDSSFSDDGTAPIACFAPLMLIIGHLQLEILSVE